MVWKCKEHPKNLYLVNKIKNYSKTTHACFTLLKGWCKQQSADSSVPNKMGVVFTNVGDEDSGKEDVLL